MTKKYLNIHSAAALLFLLIAVAVVGCKTGKGCDCPTFGKNETPKVNRF